MIAGQPAVLVYDGKLIPELLDRERGSPDEVYGEWSGLKRVEQVRWALLETDGKISFIPFAHEDKQIKPRSEFVG